MALQPTLNHRMLVRGVVITDQIEFFLGRCLAVDQAQKPEPLLMPMARLARADHRAIQRVQRGKQRRRAMPFIVVGQRRGTAALERQSWRRAIQCLHLAFLIAAQHQGVCRWIQIQTDDVLKLLNELRIRTADHARP